MISGVSHRPLVPGDDEDVSVTALVQDPDGVGTVTLYWSLNDPVATMASIAMQPIGDGRYRATVPGQSLGTRVIFWIRATDAGGRTGRFPLDVVNRTHPSLLNPARSGGARPPLPAFFYKHDVADIGAPYAGYRFFMSNADEAYLDARVNLSNDQIPGTFLYGTARAFYGASTRFAGSPFARGQWGSMRVYLPRDASFHEPLRKFNLDDHHGTGADARERISHYLLSKSQGSGGTPYSDSQSWSAGR